MGIEAVQTKGISCARIRCDSCKRDDVVPCDYERGSGGAWTPMRGQALRKAKGQGWAEVKGNLLCPKCEAKRRATAKKPAKPAAPMWFDAQAALAEIQKSAKGTEAMNETTTLRRPTPKQERLIILALEDAYDDQNKRFKGTSTDKTLADELGDGILFGWVAEIRERLFGPSGGNEEIEAIRAELQKTKADLDAKCAALTKRIDAVVTAVGPRAARTP